MPDEVMKFFWNFSLTFSFFLWHQKGKLSKKERKYSKYKVVLFIRKQRLPTVSAILNIGWLAPNVSMPPRPFLNGFEMMRFFLGVYFCIFSTFLKYFYLPTFPILWSLNPDYSFIRQPLQLHILKLTFDVWPSILVLCATIPYLSITDYQKK